MREVIFKDLFLNWRMILVNALVFGAFMSYMAWQSDTRVEVFTLFSTVMVTFAPVAILTRENAKTLSLGCSLPVTRRTIVRARYVLMFGLAALGVVFAMTLGATLPFSRLDATALFSGRAVGIALVVAAVLIALVVPFTMRFGAFGLIIALVSLQVVGGVLLIAVRITRSSADKRIAAAVMGAVRGLHDRLGPLGFDLALVAFVVLVLTVSYAVSVRVFERRDL